MSIRFRRGLRFRNGSSFSYGDLRFRNGSSFSYGGLRSSFLYLPKTMIPNHCFIETIIDVLIHF